MFGRNLLFPTRHSIMFYKIHDENRQYNEINPRNMLCLKNIFKEVQTKNPPQIEASTI